MTTLINSLQQDEAQTISDFLASHKIRSHISGDSAYNSGGYKAAPKIALLVPRMQYSKAIILIKEHYPQFIAKAEESICSACFSDSIHPKYELSNIGLFRGLFTFFMIYIFHKSYCPSCRKLH